MFLKIALSLIACIFTQIFSMQSDQQISSLERFFIDETAQHTNLISQVYQLPEDIQKIIGFCDIQQKQFWYEKKYFLHERSVRSAQLHENGTLITASEDKNVRLWNAKTGEIILVIPHDNPVWTACLNKNGTKVITGSLIAHKSEKGAACIFDAQTGELLDKFLHEGDVFSVKFDQKEERLITGTKYGAYIWDIATKTVLLNPDINRSRCNTADLDQEEKRLIITRGGSWLSETLDAHTGEHLKFFSHSCVVNSTCISQNGILLATASHDQTACIWNSITGEKLVTLRPKSNHPQSGAFLSSVSFSHDDQSLVTAGDNSLCIWNTINGKLLANVISPSHVSTAHLDPKGTTLVTATTENNRASFWKKCKQYTPEQVTLCKLLYTWAILQRPNKNITSPAYLLHTVATDLSSNNAENKHPGINCTDLVSVWATFSEGMQNAVWNDMNTLIQRYGTYRK